jgi:hypothetical protein
VASVTLVEIQRVKNKSKNLCWIFPLKDATRFYLWVFKLMCVYFYFLIKILKFVAISSFYSNCQVIAAALKRKMEEEEIERGK